MDHDEAIPFIYISLEADDDGPAYKYSRVPRELIERMMRTRVSSIRIYRRGIQGKYEETEVATMP